MTPPSGAAVTTPAALAALPKVELHVHLEGTIEAARITDLADTAGVELPRPVDRLFEAADLSEFLAFLDWTGSLVTTPDLAAGLAHDYARRAHADGIRYAEVIVNPTHWGALSLDDLLAGVAAGFDTAHDEGLADCRILVSILRQQSADDAEALASHLAERTPAPGRRPVGRRQRGRGRAHRTPLLPRLRHRR